MGDIFGPALLRGPWGNMAGSSGDPNLSRQDRAIQGLLGLGWIPALLGGGDLIVDGQRWYSWTLTGVGILAYVASYVWPPPEGWWRRILTLIFAPIANNINKIALGVFVLAWMFLAYEVSGVRADLDAWVTPRTLKSSQSERITDFLRKSSKTFTVEITADPKDQEAWLYASQFQEPINNAGWKAVWNPWQGPRAPDAPPLAPGSPPAAVQPSGEGLMIDVPVYAPDSDTARKTLAGALYYAGLEKLSCTISGGPRLILLVGHRPTPVADTRTFRQRVIEWLENDRTRCA
jgi:hypothetical protein